MSNPFDKFVAPESGGSSFYDGVRSLLKPLNGRITSTNGGRHNTGSEHYSGRAVDVGMGRESSEQQEAIKAQLEAAGYRVRDERKRPAGQAVWSGPHLHVSKPDSEPAPRLQLADALGGGSGGGGGTGGYSAPAANAFDQFDSAADALGGANPFDAFDAPDFSNLRETSSSTEGAQDAPDYSSAFAEDPGNLGKIGLRALVGRIPELTANLAELPGNFAGAIGDALPGGSMTGTMVRVGFDKLGELVRALGYENDMQATGYGAPSVTGGEVLDALNPTADVPLGERASRVANFVPETLVGSAPDMLAAVGAPTAYLVARTNEVAENRAANDQRTNPSLTDLAVAAPTAAAESLLERLTTMRLLPGGGGAAMRPGVAAAAGRVAKETGLQGAAGAVEEAIPYLAETLGTETPTTGRGLAEALATGLVAEGALGGGAQGIKEAAGAIPSRAPTAPASLADLAIPPPTLPAVAAEGPASPRQGDAPAAPPTSSVVAKPEPTPAIVEPTPPADRTDPTGVPSVPAARDMAAATRSIDDRLAALDDTAAGQIDEAEVSTLNTERQELDDLLREQDRAKREGLIQSPESRLSPEERATADARRTEIAATLERHRAARTAADQAQRLRTRLENTDSDAGLFEVAREINPTLGTPQAETFRAPAVKNNSTPEIPPSPPAAAATPSVPTQATAEPSRTAPPVSEPVLSQSPAPPAAAPEGVPVMVTRKMRDDLTGLGYQPADVGKMTPQQANDAIRNGTRAPETGIPVSPRAESQREPAADTNSPNPEIPSGRTSLKNADTDAERIAEGRDPIIRAARKGNRETVDEAVRAIRETPSIGRATAARLAEGGPVELKDEAVLLVHKVDLRKRRDAAAERAQSPNVSEEARAIARREYDDAVQQIDEVDQAASRIGTESGRLLQLRKRMIAEDYSLPALERKLRMVVNRDLKPAEQSEIKELADKVATLQRKLDAVESQQASAQVADMLARLMKQAPGKNATLAERRAAAMESKAALSAMSSARAPQRSIPDTPYDAALKVRRDRAMEMRAEGGSLADYADSEHAYWLRGGKPRADGGVTLYRAVRPGGSIQPGDYVTNSRAYAAQHLRDNLGGDGEILSVDGWADEIFPADGPGEFWYAPRSLDRGMDPAGQNVMRSQAAPSGKPGQARAVLAARLGRGVVARLERAGVLDFDERSGGTWDGTKIGIGNVSPENALGVLLHEVTHANMLDVLGEQGYERALRDLDALEAAGDQVALKAKRRAAKSGETGQRLDDERIAYMVEEATNATAPAPKVTEFVRSLFSAFRRWAATSAVFRALEKIGVDRPTLKPADFAAFARKGLDRMVAQARQPVGSADRDRIRQLETELRTDYKTGIRNQRAFDEDADLGWKGVAAMDMDGLKKINDQLGHDTGDAVLRALANELSAAETPGARFYRLSGAGDEFAGRFKTQADADRMMAQIQSSLDELQVDLDVADAEGQTRYYTYQGIGISYGTGADYGTADTAANQQKADRLAAGVREAPRADGPSRRIRESAARPGGRREGDPPAVGAQRSVPDQTQTPALKRWFGDSKVVDANGDPLVVYHGTDSTPFEVFDRAKGGSGPSKFGFWFTNQESFAEFFGGTMIPVYLKAENPKRITLEKWDSIRDRHAKDGEWFNRWREELIAQGHDGLMVAGGTDQVGKFTVQNPDVLAVFNPTQIKSATGNRGTFDPADPNIMRSIPEGEDAAPAGADPVAFFHLARMGAFHYADGARTESEWTQRMEADLGPAVDRYRSMLPDAFKASKAQADRVAKGPESVAEAVEAIGDQRRPRDVKRVVRAVVAEGMRGEEAIISATAQALDMDDADVRTMFVQSESQARTLTEAQAELKDLRKQLRDAQKPDPEARYQDTRARDFQRRIADLEARIAAGDFAKREKTERDLIERNKRLQFELEKTKERFHQYAIEAEFQNRTPIGKIFGETVAGINFARAIMTSLDLSAILRQGGKISFGHPMRALKAVPGSLKAFVSEDADFRARQEIESRPNAPLYKRFGLELTSIGGDALSRTEEAYASRWVDKLPTAAGGGLIRGSGRSYTAFLNRLRADSFDAMLAALARDGSNPTKEEGKAIANYINVATGRGKVGKNEKSGEVLNTVFFAPRLVASRFQLLAGQPLYGGSNRTRKMIAMEYARFLIGVSVATGLAMLMRDEDDETKPIELDPRSANFGKVRFGDTFLDPLAGLAQVTVFLSRVATGETRSNITADESRQMAGEGVDRGDRTGALKSLRDENRLTDVAPGLGDGYELRNVGYGGTDIPKVIMSFIRSKLAPVPGAIINVWSGKDMLGEKVTPLSAAGELVTPMSVGNLVDVLESQGMARGTAINLLGILGMSVQYRKSDEEKAVEEANGVPGMFSIGTADRSTDEQP